MGLFDKALHELEAGRPRSGAGLFAKAQDSLGRTSSPPGKPEAKPAQAAKAKSVPAIAPTSGPKPGPRPQVVLVEVDEPPVDTESFQELEAEVGVEAISSPDWPAALPAQATANLDFSLSAEGPEPGLSSASPYEAIAAFSEPAVELAMLDGFQPGPSDLEGLGLDETFIPFSAADLEALAAEVKALPRGFDSLFSAFSRISEALPLAELGLFSCEPRLIRPIAAIGRDLLAEPFELVDPAILRKPRPGAAIGPDSEPGLAEIAAYLGEGSRHVYVQAGADGKPFAFWTWIDPVLESSGELEEAFIHLIEASPLPPAKIEFVRPIKPEVAGQRIRLGQGKAVAILYDMASYVSQTAILIPGLDETALINLCRTVVSTILGSEGSVFLLSDSRILAILYSKAVPDAELALVQLGKSISRTLPFLGTADFPHGRATTLDLASAQAVEIIELFASE
jgi:hypothetical protein